jgi:hypothetical protein
MNLPDLHDSATQVIVGWIGAALVAVVTGIWTVFKFMKQASKKEEASPDVRASHGGVAAGRDIRDSKIEIRKSKES